MLGMINIARIFTSFFETEEVVKDEKGNVIEDSDGNSEQMSDVKEAIDYGCIAADFPDDMLAIEIMKLGHDPSNLNRSQMIEMLYQKMEEQKPVSETLENKEDENI